jgi:polyisoprenoid-binding protein YceI
MRSRFVLPLALVASALIAIPSLASAQTPVTLKSARITVSGTTNVHDYTASTTSVKLTRVQLGSPSSGTVLDDIVKPGSLEALEIGVSAKSLESPKHDFDDNMHKALKVQQHPDITFRLTKLESASDGAVKALGTLRIAGVERDVTLDLKTRRKDDTLVVSGQLALLMTDYGITPPKAMLGMLKTDPKVTLTLEAVLTAQ